MASNLLPCPFCNSSAMPGVNWAQCSNYACPAFHIHTTNLEAWNRRATQPAPAEPVYQWHDETAWQECTGKREYLHAKDNGLRVRILWTAPPAAAPVAAGEPVAEFFVEFETLRKAMSIYGLAAPASNSELGALMERYAVELIEAVADRPFPYPPAAAHGDEAVLWIECDPSAAIFDRLPKDWQFLFSTKIHQDHPGDRSPNVVFPLHSAMRAQGDGGADHA